MLRTDAVKIKGKLTFSPGRGKGGETGPSPDFRDARAADRARVELDAGLRQRGASGVAVTIIDLSTHGFRASTHLDLPPGTDVWLKLPGLESLHATVVWMNGYFVGCAFERPLHPAVYQMVVGKTR